MSRQVGKKKSRDDDEEEEEEENEEVEEDEAEGGDLPEGVFEVEQILDCRVTPSGRGQTVQYKIKWVGYGLDETTWENEDAVDGAPKKLAAFEKKHPDRTKSARLNAFLKTKKRKTASDSTPSRSSSSAQPALPRASRDDSSASMLSPPAVAERSPVVSDAAAHPALSTSASAVVGSAAAPSQEPVVAPSASPAPANMPASATPAASTPVSIVPVPHVAENSLLEDAEYAIYNGQVGHIEGSYPDAKGRLLHLVRWQHKDTPVQLPSTYMNKHHPQTVIQYYESRIKFFQKAPAKKA